MRLKQHDKEQNTVTGVGIGQTERHKIQGHIYHNESKLEIHFPFLLFFSKLLP